MEQLDNDALPPPQLLEDRYPKVTNSEVSISTSRGMSKMVNTRANRFFSKPRPLFCSLCRLLGRGKGQSWHELADYRASAEIVGCAGCRLILKMLSAHPRFIGEESLRWIPDNSRISIFNQNICQVTCCFPSSDADPPPKEFTISIYQRRGMCYNAKLTS